MYVDPVYVEPELEAGMRTVAGFSEETYTRLAIQGELFRKFLDVCKLWAKRNPVHS